MKQYIRYEIKERKYSANIIIGIYIILNDKNEEIEKYDIVLMSSLNKQEGDIMINNTYNLIK